MLAAVLDGNAIALALKCGVERELHYDDQRVD
jgi:hypothetical protein